MTEVTPEEVEQRRPKNRGRTPKYPWDKWSNGSWHELWHGRDFTCSVQSMRTNAYQYAKHHKLAVETSSPDEETLFVRFRADSGRLREFYSRAEKEGEHLI